jgi:hypothetical protein
MVIYMQHPVYGKKVATLELEAAYDEANGWTRYDPEAPAPTPFTTPQAVEPDPETTVNAFIPTLVGRRRK